MPKQDQTPKKADEWDVAPKPHWTAVLEDESFIKHCDEFRNSSVQAMAYAKEDDHETRYKHAIRIQTLDAVIKMMKRGANGTPKYNPPVVA